MSALPRALQNYKAQNFSAALQALAPLLKKPDALSTEILLIAAQCYAKTNQHLAAADFYGKAADRGGPKQAMLRTLASNMLREASESHAALNSARVAARSGEFDAHAEESYRRYLHEFLCLDETLMDDQRILDRMRASDARYLGTDFPFTHILWCADESLNARQTKIHQATAFTAETRAARRAFPHAFTDKIRIGYLSADFSDDHPTMRLLQGVLFQHDRTKFDVTLFCHTDAATIRKDSGMRARYPNLMQIGHLSDRDAANLIRQRGIDILVDLKGHTKGARLGVVNLGAAPIQAAYLGFPGSGTGIDCDYVIGDRIVTPESSRPFYHEKICSLPDSYQANDDIHRPLPPAASRARLGLPEDRIVFASFNAARKITSHTAQLWADILLRVPQSVLWIMCADQFTRENFTEWMENAGISRERIIFAKPVEYAEHLARLQAADIGLDTFPYNGHTTTSDKLWAGLPVPTYKGSHFASRVSESLLTAIGLEELVAADAQSYVDLCVALAEAPERVRVLKGKLDANRRTAPLFNTILFTRNLEKAYTMMVDRARQGLEPDHIDVISAA
ncbi:O-linked N-acetylglucosamine transferase family protein [Pararhizobium sp. O133]|uniref:O-linked N-acetylglucosamine transferase, SPINDLY family protein n=1 Tax=Pararhizobium sp. O133 TaxID=3449278 RepID=UPI003F68823B